jgi:hypothetical protein
MTPLFKKMNFKNQDKVHILNHPEEFRKEFEAMQVFTKMTTRASGKIEFALMFAENQKTLNQLFAKVKDKLVDDVALWISFPKKSSKKYKSDINRDQGWGELGKAEFESVKIIAIDSDWSALRFRRVQHIKEIKRSDKMVLSKAGMAKKKAGKK